MSTKKEILTTNISARLQEIAGYQMNIDNYTSIIADLCYLSLPEGIDPSTPLEQLAVGHDFEALQVIGDFQFRECLRVRLVMEKLEQRKSKLVLQALQKQLNELNEVE